MPIYEYRRPDGTTFDLVQSFSDEPLSVDPETGVPVERVLHAPAVHFKGKGFYATDYGKRARNRDGGESGESAGGGEKASEKGKDATKTPAKEAPSGGSSANGASGAKSSSGASGAKSSSGDANAVAANS